MKNISVKEMIQLYHGGLQLNSVAIRRTICYDKLKSNSEGGMACGSEGKTDEKTEGKTERFHI